MFTRMPVTSPIAKSVAPVPLARSTATGESKTEFEDVHGLQLLPEVKASPTPEYSLRAMPRDSMLAISAMRTSMKKELKIVFGASYQVSTNADGLINQVISNDLCTAQSEFTNMATLFSEFFINEFEAVYQPVSRYTKGGITALSTYSDLPLVVVDLQHGKPAYSSHTSACAAGNLIVANTADPWKMKWRNTEQKRAGVVSVSGSTTANPSQGWCLTDATNADLYTGSLQIISPAAYNTGAPSTQLFGTVVVRWSVSFRSRN